MCSRNQFANSIYNLQSYPDNIRNICILAHVDHGKTTLADTLVASNGIISQKLAGKIRYMDSRDDEQTRGITMKSSAISLIFCEDKKRYLINLIDSPGHIDFSSEVSTAVRLCDGALVLVDVVEGVCPQTYAVLRQAWLEKIRPVLILNKIDRLITELRFSPQEAYLTLRSVLEQVNVICAELFSQDKFFRMEAAVPESTTEINESVIDLEDAWLEGDEIAESNVLFSPERGNVVFASAIDGWGFRLQDFAEIFAKKIGIRPDILTRFLWGDYYINTKTKRFMKNAESKGKKPLFVQLILENLWALYNAVLSDSGSEKLEKITSLLGVSLSNRDKRTSDSQTQLQAVCSQWLPLSKAVLSVVVQCLPSPREISDERIEHLMCSNSVLSTFQSLPQKTQHLKDHFLACSCDKDKPVIAFISKMFVVDSALLPKNKRKPLTADELRIRREFVIQKRKERSENTNTSSEMSEDDGKNNTALPAVTDEQNGLNEGESEAKNSHVHLALARVFSGTLRKGDSLYILNPKYIPTKAFLEAYSDSNFPGLNSLLKPLNSDLKQSSSDSKQSCADSKQSDLDSKQSSTDSKLRSNLDLKHSNSDSKQYSSDSKQSFSDSKQSNSGLKEAISDSKQSSSDSEQSSSECFDQLKYVSRVEISDLFLLMGREIEAVNEVCAGNIVGISGLEPYVLKTATLSSCLECPAFTEFYSEAKPIVRVALEPESTADMTKLASGLRLLNLSDPCVETMVQSTGEFVIVAAGEVHLQKCIDDLKGFSGVQSFHVSEPIVPFRETIVPRKTVDMANEAVLTNIEKTKFADDDEVLEPGLVQVSAGQCTVKIRALPLPESITEFLVDNEETLGKLSALFSRTDKTEQTLVDSIDDLKDLRHNLTELIIQAGKRYRGVADNIWAFGPRNHGPNILVNKIDDFNRSIWQSFDTELAPKSRNNALKDYENCLVNGFQLATLSGPICEEPMHGVCFIVENCHISDNPSTICSLDTTDRGSLVSSVSGQLICLVKETCRKAFQTQPQRLMLAMYKCQIQATAEVLGKLYAVLNRRQGRVLSETMREGSAIFTIEAVLPVIESFGFAKDIRKKTSGLASPQLKLSHWEILDLDPYWTPITEEEFSLYGEKWDSDNHAKAYMNKVRKRKGLKVDEKLVEFAEKQRTLKKNK